MQATIPLIVKVLNEKKANKIDLFDFHGGPFIHESMIIASVSNPRLLDAIGDYIMEALQKDHQEIHHVEGTQDSGWILIDTPTVLVHLFLDDIRDYYQLDVLWADKKVERYDD